MNSVGNVYCDKCNARLVPMTAPSQEEKEEQKPTTIKGLSLPTIPLEKPLEEKEQRTEDVTAGAGAEDWLAQLRGSAAEEAEEPERLVEPVEPEGGDWLAQLRGSAVEEAEEPERLTEPVEPEGGDWLAQLRGSTVEEAEKPERLVEPVEPEGGDWLAQLRGSTVEEAEEPERLAEPVEPEGGDWLAQLRGSAVEEAEEPERLVEPVEPEGGDWLAQLRGSAVEGAKEPEVTDEPVEPVEIPSWLHDLGPAGVDAQPTPDAKPPTEKAPAMPPLTPAEIPDWLQKVAPPEAEPALSAVEGAEIPAPEEAIPAVPEPALAEIPDWLQEAAPPEVAPPVAEVAPEEVIPAAPEPALAGIPDWLQEIAPPEVAPPEAEPVTSAVEGAKVPAPEEVIPTAPEPVLAEIPDWLREAVPPEAEPVMSAIEGAEIPAPEEVVPAAPEIVLAGIPDWLQEVAPPVAELAPEEAIPTVPEPALSEAEGVEGPAPEEAPPPFVSMPPTVMPEIPEWLREVAPEQEAAPETAPSVPPLVEFPLEAKIAEAPEWLAELGAEPAPAAPVFEGTLPPIPSEPGVRVAQAPDLARAEIPDWLEAIRPRAEVAEEAVEEALLETEGLLEGLRGVLSPTLAIEVPAVRESALPAEAREASLARARLLQSLLSRPAEMPQPKVHKPGTAVGERLQRLIVAIVFLVPIVGILVWPYMVPESAVPTLVQPDTSRAETLYNAIADTGVENTVLVAFEYGPVEADELDLVAAPILQHLITRGARISVVSTRPEGLTVAEALLNHLEASEEQYTLHAYKPGGAIGVSQLLADAGARPDLILVLTGQPASLRWWVEQTHARWEVVPPVVAGVSAALEAAASPYLDTNAGQLKGTIGGLSGAAAYERYGGMEERAIKRLNALAVGHLVVVGLMLVGAAIYPLAGLRRKGE